MAGIQALQIRSKQKVNKSSEGRSSLQSKVLPAEVNVVQKQVLNQQQSLEVVQTLLLSSISSLAYLRELFPDHCFEKRIYSCQSTRETYHSYEDFVDGTKLPSAPNDTAQPNDPHQHSLKPLTTLVRGRNPAADKLLNWLESGIFDALKKNYLDAMQLTIFEDRVTPTNVFESYTFSFKYSGDEKNDSRRLTGLELQDSSGNPITVRTIKYGLQTMCRKLVELCTHLPELPDRRFLTIHLLYTKECPMEYEPVGFQKCEDRSIVFPESPDLVKQTTSCGQLDTGLHRVSLKVRSLHWKQIDETYPDTSAQIPNNLSYGERLSHTEDTDRSDAETSDTHTIITSASTPKRTRERTSSRTDNVGHLGVQYQDESVHTGDTSGITKAADTILRRQDDYIRQALRQMLPLELAPRDSDLVSTQLLSQNAASFGLDQPYQQLQLREKPKIGLSQRKMKELEVRREKLGLKREIVTRDIPQDNVHCECGWTQDEGDMVRCECCSTWQHAQCYGFRELRGSSQFASHVCYTCLLSEKEMSLLHEMISLVVFRRALRVIYEAGYPKASNTFAELLHCDSKTAHEVTRRLRVEGYLISTPGSHSKGFSQKNLPRFMVVESKAQRERMEDTYFDPLARIAHHYELPDVPSMNTDSSTSLGGFPAATAPERDTLGTAGPETGIVMSKLNVTSFSKTEDPRDVRLTMSTDRSQNSKAHGIASNQDTGSRTLHQTSLQRKRHYDEHDGNRGPKRTKSSAPEQPIDVGAIEE